MKANKTAIVALSILLSMQAVASQGKYLGKKVEDEKPAEVQPLPKVNLLTDETLKVNSHLRNDPFGKKKTLPWSYKRRLLRKNYLSLYLKWLRV